VNKAVEHREMNLATRGSLARVALALVGVLLGAITTNSAQAQGYQSSTYKVLYSFTKDDGNPNAGLTFDTQGKPIWHNIQWRRLRCRNRI
jgi:hypothetical protein